MCRLSGDNHDHFCVNFLDTAGIKKKNGSMFFLFLLQLAFALPLIEKLESAPVNKQRGRPPRVSFNILL